MSVGDGNSGFFCVPGGILLHRHINWLGEKYKGQITIHYNDMYEKEYYVLEPDGSIYLESGSGDSDQLIRRLV